MTGVYVDPQIVHDPVTGTVAPAAWGDVLRNNGEFLIDPPQCTVSHNTTQSIPNNALTVVLANTETTDTDTMHSTVSNTSRIVATTPGRYEFDTLVIFATDIDGRRAALFRHTAAIGGATTDYNLPSFMAVTSGNSTNLGGSRKIVMAVGDYVEVFVLHVAGAALNVTLEEFSAVFRSR